MLNSAGMTEVSAEIVREHLEKAVSLDSEIVEVLVADPMLSDAAAQIVLDRELQLVERYAGVVEATVDLLNAAERALLALGADSSKPDEISQLRSTLEVGELGRHDQDAIAAVAAIREQLKLAVQAARRDNEPQPPAWLQRVNGVAPAKFYPALIALGLGVFAVVLATNGFWTGLFASSILAIAVFGMWVAADTIVRASERYGSDAIPDVGYWGFDTKRIETQLSRPWRR